MAILYPPLANNITLMLIMWDDLAICLKFLIFKSPQIVNVDELKLCNVHDTVFIRGWWLSLTALSLLCNIGVITMSTVISTKNPPWYKHQVKPWFGGKAYVMFLYTRINYEIFHCVLLSITKQNFTLQFDLSELTFKLVVLHYWHLLSLIHISVSIFWRKR